MHACRRHAGLSRWQPKPISAQEIFVGVEPNVLAPAVVAERSTADVADGKLQRLDPVKEASPHIGELAEQTEQSIAVAVWGNMGPTIVRLEEPTQPLHVNLRTGTVMSLMNTATGRLFATFMPPKVIEKAMQGELARMGAVGLSPLTQTEFDLLVSETRRHGLSRSLSQPIPGIDAFCAPVFDSAGNIVLGLLAMGPSATFDSAWDGKVATALRRCANEVSRKLGYEVAEKRTAA